MLATKRPAEVRRDASPANSTFFLDSDRTFVFQCMLSLSSRLTDPFVYTRIRSFGLYVA